MKKTNKNSLLTLIANGETHLAIETLLEILPEKHTIYNKIILLQGQWKISQNKLHLGLEDRKSIGTEFNRISNAIIEFLSEMSESDYIQSDNNSIVTEKLLIRLVLTGQSKSGFLDGFGRAYFEVSITNKTSDNLDIEEPFFIFVPTIYTETPKWRFGIVENNEYPIQLNFGKTFKTKYEILKETTNLWQEFPNTASIQVSVSTIFGEEFFSNKITFIEINTVLSYMGIR